MTALGRSTCGGVDSRGGRDYDTVDDVTDGQLSQRKLAAVCLYTKHVSSRIRNTATLKVFEIYEMPGERLARLKPRR